ncbi:hypothetical protein ElyMa_005509600 [Elysia marginata]|uniref:Uncharacterized protein n=1 Tax=Elysia marginata TaxID=1093978 RepID=A0AAV4EUQ5_9GAST|nr:hypothetical protein ElyMa_005509600 [Elysia marginata]
MVQEGGQGRASEGIIALPGEIRLKGRGWDFSPCVSSISRDKMRHGKGVVEKAKEQLKPKLSGIQREEAKYRDAILLESPQGKEVPMKIVKTVALGSLLGMGMSLKSRQTKASGSQPMGEVLVQV